MKIKTYFSENSKLLLSFVLFFILTFAIPANVYAGKNDSIQITKNVNTLFYISSNTTVYGAVYSSNDKSERSEKKISSKKKVSSKKSR